MSEARSARGRVHGGARQPDPAPVRGDGGGAAAGAEGGGAAAAPPQCLTTPRQERPRGGTGAQGGLTRVASAGDADAGETEAPQAAAPQRKKGIGHRLAAARTARIVWNDGKQIRPSLYPMSIVIDSLLLNK